jgi:hypothetical protein
MDEGDGEVSIRRYELADFDQVVQLFGDGMRYYSEENGYTIRPVFNRLRCASHSRASPHRTTAGQLGGSALPAYLPAATTAPLPPVIHRERYIQAGIDNDLSADFDRVYFSERSNFWVVTDERADSETSGQIIAVVGAQSPPDETEDVEGAQQ